MEKSPKHRRIKSIPFEMSILAKSLDDTESGQEWKPFLEGTYTYTEDATCVPFSGFLAGTTTPVTGMVNNSPSELFGDKRKHVGRPSAIFRDVAVTLAYIYMEFANPELNVTALRNAVCDIWNGRTKELLPNSKWQGIKNPDHVKRAMKRAIQFAPELGERVRIEKHLHSFEDNPLAGCLLSVIQRDGKAVELIFEPPLVGLVGEPYCHAGHDGFLFKKVPGWLWIFGEEAAKRIEIDKCWRPKKGTIKVSPTFSDKA